MGMDVDGDDVVIGLLTYRELTVHKCCDYLVTIL